MTFHVHVKKVKSLHKLFWGDDLPEVHDSGRGWSYYSSLELCARRHFLNYEVGLVKEPDLGKPAEGTGGRTRGWLLHAMKQTYRLHDMSVEGIDDAEARIRNVEREPAFTEVAFDAARLFTAWLLEYRDSDLERYKVVGVERRILKRPWWAPTFEYSARFDALLALRDDPTTILISEDKHLASLKSETELRYALDGQVMGQLWLARNYNKWKRAGLNFPSVIVDITICTKEPKFYRPEIVHSDAVLEAHMRSLSLLAAERPMMAATGWRQSRAACGYPYHWSHGGLCEFAEVCLDHEWTLEDFYRGVVPPGFVRKEALTRRVRRVG